MSDLSDGLDSRDAVDPEGTLGAGSHAAPDGTLAAAISGRGAHPLALPAPLPLVVDLVAQLATQLAALHARGQVYGALDPAHVLLLAEPGESLRVELAPPDAAAGQDTFAISGFTAPERFEGEHGQAADQYALAALTYLLLTGEPPFVGSPTEQAFEQLFTKPEPPRRLNPSLPFAVSAVVLRGLAKWPEDRYPAVAAFSAALRYAAGEAPESAVPLPPWLRQTSAPSRPFVVTPREPTAAPASVPPPRGLVPLEDPPPTAHEETGAWRAAAPPPIVAPPLPEPRSRYPLLSPRARNVQVAVACALLLALLLGAGLATAAASPPHPQAAAPVVVRAPATATPQPSAPPAPTTAPTSTPAPSPTPPPTPVPTNTPAPTPTTGPIEAASSGDAAAVGPIVAPSSVAPRQQFTVRLTLVNTGHTTWSSGTGYSLACDIVRHPATSCSSAFSAGLGGAVVAPGGSVTFTLTLIAPSGPGTYQAWFAMAHNGRLFPSTDAAVRVTVS
ncbi:MAG TPA: NBR1-Ig-like domain-containing protein [Ktedonobacterales bacterium]